MGREIPFGFSCAERYSDAGTSFLLRSGTGSGDRNPRRESFDRPTYLLGMAVLFQAIAGLPR